MTKKMRIVNLMEVFIRNSCLVILSLFCLGCNAEIEQYPVLFKSSSNLDSPYGFCSHINRIGPQWEFDGKEKDLAMMRSVGADFVRTDFDWGYCQPDKNGPMSFSHHDKMMQTVDSSDIQMLGILSSPQPHDYKKWLNYVNMTAMHFKRNVQYWEVINEADRWHLRFPDYQPDDYIRIIRDAYPLVKRGNKKAKVLFTSITDINGEFFKRVLNAGISDCFDIMNFHFYVNDMTEPEYLFKYFKTCNEILKRHHIQKPVWFTETGCVMTSGSEFEEIQARRLPRIFLISFACGVDKVFWYKSRATENSNHFDEHLGAWHKDYTPKQAYYAYKTLTSMCPSGSTRPKITKKGNVYMAVWKQPQGKYVTALWTSKGTETVNAKSYVGDIYDIKGDKISFDSEKIDVSTSILYCISSRNLVLN